MPIAFTLDAVGLESVRAQSGIKRLLNAGKTGASELQSILSCRIARLQLVLISNSIVHQKADRYRLLKAGEFIRMSVKISTREVGDIVVMDISGRIKAGDGSNIFRQAIRDQVAQGTKNHLLNL